MGVVLVNVAGRSEEIVAVLSRNLTPKNYTRVVLLSARLVGCDVFMLHRFIDI